VNLISKLPGGENIPVGGRSDPIDFPGVSVDGTHVLMATFATSAPNGPMRLYMRVNDAISYEVSEGVGVTFAGMTKTGDKVYFTTSANLTEDDTDSSSDLYMWSENSVLEGEPLTLVSQGNGQGNSDSCSTTWISGCGVEPLLTERVFAYRTYNGGNLKTFNPNVPGEDDALARDTGDIYFYSPEILDPTRPGIPGERNLYLFRNGALHLVDALDPGTRINRVQISDDGSHAGFLTPSRLTSYDNRGIKEVYVYDANTEIVRCASCNPSGLPPSSDVRVSEGGPFMANNGRAFFVTKDPLVPRDTNNAIYDVYEYVDGRPQLISAGTGARDLAEATGLFETSTYTGLESVSRDGTDVFFSTYDTLVDADQNGNFVKFYDARVNGGFVNETPIAPCAAADECHSVDSSRPADSAVSTGGAFGAGGNVKSQKTKRKGSKRKRKRCTHGKVRRGKRCVSKRASKAARHHKRHLGHQNHPRRAK
jgi:hypothetical protein